MTNNQIHAVQTVLAMADDAVRHDEAHEAEMLKMRQRFDRSTALHEFILNARYEKAHPPHTHR